MQAGATRDVSMPWHTGGSRRYVPHRARLSCEPATAGQPWRCRRPRCGTPSASAQSQEHARRAGVPSTRPTPRAVDSAEAGTGLLASQGCRPVTIDPGHARPALARSCRTRTVGPVGLDRSKLMCGRRGRRLFDRVQGAPVRFDNLNGYDGATVVSAELLVELPPGRAPRLIELTAPATFRPRCADGPADLGGEGWASTGTKGYNSSQRRLGVGEREEDVPEQLQHASTTRPASACATNRRPIGVEAVQLGQRGFEPALRF
jgi:hypothetical protein